MEWVGHILPFGRPKVIIMEFIYDANDSGFIYDANDSGFMTVRDFLVI